MNINLSPGAAEHVDDLVGALRRLTAALEANTEAKWASNPVKPPKPEAAEVCCERCELLREFTTERELTDYAEELNQSGISPEVAITDSRGNSALGCVQAPGGDGWGFAYYAVNDGDNGTIKGKPEDEGYVEPSRYVNEYHQGSGWEPAWPVIAPAARCYCGQLLYRTAMYGEYRWVCNGANGCGFGS